MQKEWEQHWYLPHVCLVKFNKSTHPTSLPRVQFWFLKYQIGNPSKFLVSWLGQNYPYADMSSVPCQHLGAHRLISMLELPLLNNIHKMQLHLYLLKLHIWWLTHITWRSCPCFKVKWWFGPAFWKRREHLPLFHKNQLTCRRRSFSHPLSSPTHVGAGAGHGGEAADLVS